ncbi:MAG: hypothetical protein ABFS18_05645 [Thermodesulfobacteriota bacterium]
MKKVMFLFLLVSTLAMNPSPALALIAGADIFGLDFRFNNPGARANAMGGAFIGLADDATTAYTNPAGLTILTQPEVSVEYKGGNYTTRTIDETGTNDFDKSVSGLSFLSFAYPTKNTVVAIFRHQLLNNENVFSWYPKKKHGMFTYFFTLGLKGGADSNGDKKVTMNEINEFIGDNVPYMTRKLHDERQQTPSVKSADMSRVLAEYK